MELWAAQPCFITVGVVLTSYVMLELAHWLEKLLPFRLFKIKAVGRGKNKR